MFFEFKARYEFIFEWLRLLVSDILAGLVLVVLILTLFLVLIWLISESRPVPPLFSPFSDFCMLLSIPLELSRFLDWFLWVNAEISSLSPTLVVSMDCSTETPVFVWTYYVRFGLNVFFFPSANLSLNFSYLSMASSIKLLPRLIDLLVVVLLRISESLDLITFLVRMRLEFKLLLLFINFK